MCDARLYDGLICRARPIERIDRFDLCRTHASVFRDWHASRGLDAAMTRIEHGATPEPTATNIDADAVRLDAIAAWTYQHGVPLPRSRDEFDSVRRLTGDWLRRSGRWVVPDSIVAPRVKRLERSALKGGWLA